jgi:hypothetical protein
LMIVGGMNTAVWDLWARSFVEIVKSRWRRRRSKDNTLESSGGNLAVSSMGREDIAEDAHSRRSIASVRDAIRMVYLRRDSNDIDPGEHLGLDEGGLSKEGAGESLVPEAVTRVSRSIPVKMGIAIIAAFLGAFCGSEPCTDKLWA